MKHKIQNTNERFIKFISKLLYEHLYRKLQWLSITKPFQKSLPAVSEQKNISFITRTSLTPLQLPPFQHIFNFILLWSHPLMSHSYGLTLYHIFCHQAVVANIQPQRFLSINPLHNLHALPAGIESSVYWWEDFSFFASFP